MKLKIPRICLLAFLFVFMFLATTSTADAGIFKRHRGCKSGGCTASSGSGNVPASAAFTARPFGAIASGGCATCK